MWWRWQRANRNGARLARSAAADHAERGHPPRATGRRLRSLARSRRRVHSEHCAAGVDIAEVLLHSVGGCEPEAAAAQTKGVLAVGAKDHQRDTCQGGRARTAREAHSRQATDELNDQPAMIA